MCFLHCAITLRFWTIYMRKKVTKDECECTARTSMHLYIYLHRSVQGSKNKRVKSCISKLMAVFRLKELARRISNLKSRIEEMVKGIMNGCKADK